MTRKSWNDLTPTQRTATVAAGAVQVALAVTAWVDLARRPSALVRGRKGLWAVAIAVNFVGPITYFAVGRRQPPGPAVDGTTTVLGAQVAPAT